MGLFSSIFQHFSGEDIFEDDGEQIDGEPNCVFVTGQESWMRDYGLMKRLTRPQDEVAASNSSQADGDMPLSSLDASSTGDLGDIDEFEHKHGEATVGEMMMWIL